MPCSICDKDVSTPYETPDDPPFFPEGGGSHCQECEDWLLYGTVLVQRLEAERADLRERLNKAAWALNELAHDTLDDRECKRLLAKAEGVMLAISYVDEQAPTQIS